MLAVVDDPHKIERTSIVAVLYKLGAQTIVVGRLITHKLVNHFIKFGSNAVGPILIIDACATVYTRIFLAILKKVDYDRRKG